MEQPGEFAAMPKVVPRLEGLDVPCDLSQHSDSEGIS